MPATSRVLRTFLTRISRATGFDAKCDVGKGKAPPARGFIRKGVVNSLKGPSNQRLKVEFPAHRPERAKERGRARVPSYLVGSVGGAPIEILRHTT